MDNSAKSTADARRLEAFYTWTRIGGVSGLHPGELSIIVAREGIGKSSINKDTINSITKDTK